jgi:hypothetical protein
MTFDTKFNNIEDDSIIEMEILRQIDKSINNSIGTFHEQIFLTSSMRHPFNIRKEINEI